KDEMFMRYPILLILIPFICGIIFCAFTLSKISIFILSLFLILVFLIFSFFFDRILFLKFLSIALSFYTGIFAFYLDNKRTTLIGATDIIPPDSIIAVTGEVVSIPEIKKGKTSFILMPEKIRLGPKYYTRSGKIKVYVKDVIDDIDYGEIVQLTGKVLPVRSFKNFNTFDYEEFLKDKGIELNLYVQSSLFVKRTFKKKFSFSAIVSSIREEWIKVIRSNLSSPYSDLCAGILLGARNLIPENIKNSFIKSGTYHLFAISGFHIGIVSVFIFYLFRLLRFDRKKSSALSILFVILYSFVAGMGNSVLRAMIMAICFFVSIIIERERDLNNSLFIALFILLLINPSGLFDAGLLLTFLAAFSIINTAPFFYEKLSFVPFKYFRGLIAGTISAQIGIIPVLAYFFNYLSPIGVISNIISVPIASASFIWGLVCFFSAFLSMKIGSIFFGLQELFLYLLFTIVDYFSSFKFSYINIKSPNFVSIFLYYLIFSSLFLRGFKKIKSVLVPLSIFLLVSATIYANAGFIKPNRLTATFLDVGEGEAAVFETPNGRAFLVDTGGTFDNSFDIGEKVVASALLKNGISRLDAVFITHPHPDHINGLISLMNKLRISQIYMCGCFSEKEYLVIRDIKREAKKLGIPVSEILSGFEKDFDNVKVKVIFPKKRDCDEKVSNINNLSLVMFVNYLDKKILLTGDIERDAIEKILSRNDDISADIIKVPHHGGKSSAIKKFYARSGAKYAIISAGYKNNFNHPSQEIIEILDSLKMKFFRTDLDGAIRVSIDNSGIHICTFNKK
ncbi:MAG: DNA internalization-related competence protein ComEC/Rec2, partial [Candidatus Schekmanbacteria bacterium]